MLPGRQCNGVHSENMKIGWKLEAVATGTSSDKVNKGLKPRVFSLPVSIIRLSDHSLFGLFLLLTSVMPHFSGFPPASQSTDLGLLCKLSLLSFAKSFGSIPNH